MPLPKIGNDGALVAIKQVLSKDNKKKFRITQNLTFCFVAFEKH
jgi:hypothetical protein